MLFFNLSSFDDNSIHSLSTVLTDHGSDGGNVYRQMRSTVSFSDVRDNFEQKSGGIKFFLIILKNGPKKLFEEKSSKLGVFSKFR